MTLSHFHKCLNLPFKIQPQIEGGNQHKASDTKQMNPRDVCHRDFDHNTSYKAQKSFQKFMISELLQTYRTEKEKRKKNIKKTVIDYKWSKKSQKTVGQRNPGHKPPPWHSSLTNILGNTQGTSTYTDIVMAQKPAKQNQCLFSCIIPVDFETLHVKILLIRTFPVADETFQKESSGMFLRMQFMA